MRGPHKEQPDGCDAERTGAQRSRRSKETSERDVAQLVAHYVRDVGVGRSSRLIPTKKAGEIQPFVEMRRQGYGHCL